MQPATLLFIKTNDKILLGLKKRSIGKGKYNGFGGKVEPNESVEEAAVRELYEESGLKVDVINLAKSAELTFILPAKPEWNMVVHVFFAEKFTGEFKETEEMKPKWFNISALPYPQMWQDDQHWLPLVLDGKFVKGKFWFEDDSETIKEFLLENI